MRGPNLWTEQRAYGTCIPEILLSGAASTELLSPAAAFSRYCPGVNMGEPSVKSASLRYRTLRTGERPAVFHGARDRDRTNKSRAEAICGSKFSFSTRRLLGSLPYLMDLDTRHRSRVAVLQFVRRERGNSPFLIGSDLVL